MSAMMTIHVLAFGELYQGVLNAVVAFIGQNTFVTLLRLSALVGIILASISYLRRHDPMEFGKWIITYMVVINVVLLPRTDVAVYDVSNQRHFPVAHVPVAFAVMASLITNIGMGLAEQFDMLLSRPDDLMYTKTGSLFASKLIRAAHDFKIIDPELKTEMDSYIKNCVVGDLRLHHKYSLDELGKTNDIWGAITKKPSPLLMTTVNHHPVTCLVASKHEGNDSLKRKLDAEIKKAYTFFGINLFGKQCTVESTSSNHGCKTNYEMLFEHHLSKAFAHFQGMSNTASEIFLQSMMINALGDGIKNYQAFTDSTASVVNTQVTKSQLQHRWSWAIAGQKAAWFLPILHTVLTAMLFCIFPIIVVMMTFPTGIGILKGYLQFFLSLQMWPLLFACLNYSMNLYLGGQSSQYQGMTLVNLDKIDELHSDLAGVSGYLMLMIPFLAKGMVSNLSDAFSGLATSMTGHLEGAAMSVANEAASASFTLGQTSFYNASGNNLSLNKHDSNWTEFHGLYSSQLDNGALLTQGSNGHRVINTQGAMSSLAINLHGSDRISDALTSSMSESFAESSQLRTASDTHRQAGVSLLNQFSHSNANDYRSGEGQTMTYSDQFNQDFKVMEDSLKQWNERHDISHQLGHNEALRLSVDSNRSILGTLSKVTFGLSGAFSATGSYGYQRTSSAGEFLHSAEGRAYTEAYGNMLSVAKQHHLDATDANNLNGVNQIAANFAKSELLMEQAAAEYHHGLQKQEAANHVREHASSIDMNLNQPFHDWIYRHYGERGEQVLAQTDLQSIQQQQQWADEFFNSQEGHSVIATQVNQTLETSGHEIKHRYQEESNRLAQQSQVNAAYEKHSRTVNEQARNEGLTPMSDQHLAAAKSMLEHHHHVQLDDAFHQMNRTKERHLTRGKEQLEQDKSDRLK